MKKIIILFVGMIAIFNFGLMAQNSEKTLLKSFATASIDKVVLDLDGDVEVKQWSKETVRVEMKISVEGFNENVLKGLIAAGRYKLTSSTKETSLVISTPNLDKDVTIRGQQLKDSVVFTAYVPDNVTVEIKDSSQASASDAQGEF